MVRGVVEMGIESANYVYLPTTTGAEATDGSLKLLGVQPVESNRAACFVYRGDDYWIDLEVSPAEAGRGQAVSIRVALCNPPGVKPALRKLLETLWRRGGGRLIDLPGDRQWETIDDDACREIWRSYEVKHREFRLNFGDFEAPVSGADVFRLLREKKFRKSHRENGNRKV
jgi:hypothetical protein